MWRARLLVAMLAALALGSVSAARADQIGDLLKAVSVKLAPSIVSIRVVSTVTATVHGATQDHDITANFRGLVVSPDGLILCTNAYVSADRFKDAMESMGGAQPDDVSLSPDEIRITIGNEPTEYYGSLAAQDSSLGLAFIQIRDLKGRKLPYVDMTAPANVNDVPSAGDPTGSITRLSKTYDYAPQMIEDRVVAVVTKPRKAYLPEGFAGSLGLPVCGVDGNVIGIVASAPASDETQADAGADFLSRMFQDVINQDHSQFILPTSVVAPLIAEAASQAAALPPFTVPKPRPVKAASPAPVAAPKTSPATSPGDSTTK
jgi:hypothetical protein